jgi:Ca-activated chloride channel family protein
MSEKILQSSLKNAKFENMTAEQVIKKYEDVLNSREKQVFELSAEIGQINKKLQKMKAKYENSQEKNMKLKNILEKKEALFKQELDNKELMFMQLTKKEKECDEIQQQINDLKQNKKIIKNEKNINNEINKENNNNKKKEEEKKEKNDKDNKEADLKLLAKEKINQLTNKGEGMKKINFAELLKKKQEKTQENNQNQEKKNDTEDIDSLLELNDLLGMKLVIDACKEVDFQSTFGMNNLTIIV